MDVSLAMDQILENTSLLANVGDAEANYLINWAGQKLPSLVAEIEDEALGWQKVGALMDTLRAANTLLSRYRTASEATLLELLQKFLISYANTFGTMDASAHPIVPELGAIMRAQPDNVAALRALLDFAENVRPPIQEDEPLTPAQIEAVQNVEQALDMLRSTIGNLAESLGAFMPTDQLASLLDDNSDSEPSPPTNEQGNSDET